MNPHMQSPDTHEVRFNFGLNWEAYSRAKVDDARLEEAVGSLERLIGRERIAGKSFLDIGCGSGLFSIAAALSGASSVKGFDFSPDSIKACRINLDSFQPRLEGLSIPQFFVGSVLDEKDVKTAGNAQIVYSWGVLHHTGAMWQAISVAASLVDKDGLFAIAIYNRHWTAHCWKVVKYLYNRSPKPVKRLLQWLFAGIFFVEQLIVTGQNPFRKQRGMDFWFDVIDWIGGYPYEFALISEIVNFVEPLGFKVIKVIPTQGWTGCNEFVFEQVI